MIIFDCSISPVHKSFCRLKHKDRWEWLLGRMRRTCWRKWCNYRPRSVADHKNPYSFGFAIRKAGEIRRFPRANKLLWKLSWSLFRLIYGRTTDGRLQRIDQSKQRESSKLKLWKFPTKMRGKPRRQFGSLVRNNGTKIKRIIAKLLEMILSVHWENLLEFR